MRLPVWLTGSHPLAVLSLMGANLVPLYGILFLGWEVYFVLLLYWMESAVIGAFTLLEILIVGRRAALFIGPFFTIHYGMFMVGHLLFLNGFFGPPTDQLHSGLFDFSPGMFDNVAFALLPLIASHAISFFVNVVRTGWKGDKNPGAIMMRPYGRIITMHLTVILGAFLMGWIGTPAPAFAIVVIAKLVVDLRSHLRTYRKRRERAPASVRFTRLVPPPGKNS